MGRPLRVLIVEDSESDTGLLLRQLRQAGFEPVHRRVDTAESMRAALRDEPWELVISDYTMPGFTAPAALAVAQEAGTDIPFLVVSGSIGEDTAVTLMKRGAHDYILKGNLTRLGPAVARELREAEERAARRRAEAQLRLQGAALDAAASAIVITDRDGRIVWANPAFGRLTGYESHEVLGQNPRFLKSGVHPAAFYGTLWATILGGEVWRGEILNRRKDGSLYSEEMTITPVPDAAGVIRHFVAIKQDITERKRAEAHLLRLNRALRTISLCNQALVRAATEDELLHEICRTIVEAGGYRLAWVGYAEHDAAKTVRPAAIAGLDEGYVAELHPTWADDERGRDLTGTAIRMGVPSFARQVATDPRCAPWREAAVRRGYASAIALPLKASDGILGALHIYSAEPDAFDAKELEMLTELADDLAYGIQALRTREAHVQAEAALLERDRLNRVLLDSFPCPALLLRPGTREIVASNAAADRLGAVPGARCYATWGGQDGPCPWCLAPEVWATGESRHLEVKAQGVVWDAYWIPVNRDLYMHFAFDITERKRGEEALAARTRQLEAIRGVSVDITRELDLRLLLGLLVRRATELVGAASGTVFLWDEASQLLVPKAWHGYPAWRGDIRLRLGEGVAGTAALRRASLAVTDYRSSPYTMPFILERTTVSSVLAEPLVYGERLLGVLVLDHQEPTRSFGPQEREVIDLFASQAAIAIENARLYEEVRRHAAELEARVQARTAELAAANTQLQQASRHKSEFLANMSHEIRTPLNSIIGFSDLLLAQEVGPLNARQLRFLTNVHKSGQHLLQLINDILDLSKVEAGKFVLQPEPLDAAAVLEDILVIARGLAHKKSQQIVTDLSRDLPPLTADIVRFKQILFNLLSNAVKFTPERGTITVTCRVVEPSESQAGQGQAGPAGATPRPVDPSTRGIEISVQDTGVGIRPEDLPKLFGEFVQLETTQAQHHEGTGLGLALTRRLVELHGGRIWAASDGAGKGSTFTLRLPCGGPAGCGG